MKIFIFVLIFSLSFFSHTSDHQTPLEIDPTSLLFLDFEQKKIVFKNINKILPTRFLNKSENPYPLIYNLKSFSDLVYKINGEQNTLEHYIQKFHIGGMLIVRDNNIVYENYTLDNDVETKWISFSVTKSITSMLLGAAIKDGFIGSIDDPVGKYLPQLSGLSYKDISIKEVLHMSSGVNWNEDYDDPSSDVSLAGGLNSLDLYKYFNRLNSNSKPGEVFNYNTGETNLIGGVVRAAIGNNLSTYLQNKIWTPFGMEHDANWAIDSKYQSELGGCCISATLKDYARLGIFAMNNGVLNNGAKMLPDDWMQDSTEPSVSNKYYGYQWWLDGPGFKSFSAQGIFGQIIWIEPQTKTVVVMHGAWDRASYDDAYNERVALIKEIMKKLYLLEN